MMFVVMSNMQVWQGKGDKVLLGDQEDLGRLTAAEIQRRSDPSDAQAYAPYSNLYVADFVVPYFASSVTMSAGPLVLSDKVLSGGEADFEAAVEMATGIIKSVRSFTHSSLLTAVTAQCCTHLTVLPLITYALCASSIASAADMKTDGPGKSHLAWIGRTSNSAGCSCHSNIGCLAGT